MRAAASDLERALQAASQPDPYVEMFLYLARAKMDESAAPALLAYSAKLSPGVWPRPAIDLLLDKSAPEDLLVAAKGRFQVCEANFYAGEWRILHNQDGRDFLRAAARGCPKSLDEGHAAIGELKRLGD